mmetsp:Transcript_51966/g.160985  ORF Transcript_51966/g.160985 Transcript_51966/m.160985 type:complete len:292 (+) Transcript_51966:360-1235(+)
MQAWASTKRPCTIPGSATQEQATALPSQAQAGKGAPAPKTAAPRARERRAPTVAARTAVGKPTRTKSRTRRGCDSSFDLASTTTLAGDAVGSTKEREQATAAGSMSLMGWMTALCAAEARTGSTMVAVAMWLRNWVRKETKNTTTKVVDTQLISDRKLPTHLPKATSRPDSMKPRATAKPPPMMSRTPMSSLSCTVFQVRMASPRRTCDGRKKRDEAHKQAMTELFSKVMPAVFVTMGPMTQGSTSSSSSCSSATAPTRASSRPAGPSSARSRSCASSSTSRPSGKPAPCV